MALDDRRAPHWKACLRATIPGSGQWPRGYRDEAAWVPAVTKRAPGLLVVIDEAHSSRVQASDRAYDLRVAGVISDRPGVLLGEGGDDKVKVAHSGRVKVMVDASFGPVRAG